MTQSPTWECEKATDMDLWQLAIAEQAKFSVSVQKQIQWSCRASQI